MNLIVRPKQNGIRVRDNKCIGCMETPQQNSGPNLLPSSLSDQVRARSLYRRRINLGRAIIAQKCNNDMLKQEIETIARSVNSLEKKRHQSLLVGVKFKHLLQNVNAVRQVSQFLTQQQAIRLKKEKEEASLKRERCLHRKLDASYVKETSRQASWDKIEEVRENKLRDTISVCQEIDRLRETSRSSNRQQCERIRSDHERLRRKMKRIQQFKEARAQKNYFDKVIQATERQERKSVLLKELRQKQEQLQGLPNLSGGLVLKTPRRLSGLVFAASLGLTVPEK